MAVFYPGQNDYIERLNELMAAATGSQAWDLTCFLGGVMDSSIVFAKIPVARTVKFNAAFAGSYAHAGTAATAQTDIHILLNGTDVGTIRFAAGAVNGIFIAINPVTYIAGDILSVVGPAVPDTTLADIGIVLAGTR